MDTIQSYGNPGKETTMTDESRRPSVLVIGAQGVLGTLLADRFAAQGWTTRRGVRRPDAGLDVVPVDLGLPDTVRAAAEGVDVVVNTVPDDALVVERVVLETGGIVLNVSALPASCERELRDTARSPRGMVVMHAGIAPGLTSLVAADLVHRHPHADEIEMVFTVSTKSTNGPAGGAFAHRNLTNVVRHETRVVPLPEPYGRRRVLGFAEMDQGWLPPDPMRTVHPFVCIAEPAVQRTLLALNAIGAVRMVPRAAFRPTALRDGHQPSAEPVTHWIAVLEDGERVAVRTVETAGDYAAAAAVTVAMADVLAKPERRRAGVFTPEAVMALDELAPVLDGDGIHVVRRDGRGARLDRTDEFPLLAHPVAS
jgi:hypothetical protein